MNKEVQKLFKRGLLFLIPVLLWVIIVLLVDPFNYFNLSSFISTHAKEKSAQRLNSLLYNSIHFRNNASKHVIIGDSRIRKLPTQKIKEMTGNEFVILHSNAAKLNEIIDLFWFAEDTTTKQTHLESVIIGINFNLFNEYAYANRVADVNEMLNNPMIYIFNWNIVETVYLSVKNEFAGVAGNKKKNKAEFWDYNINTVANNHYSKWKRPEETLNRLKQVGKYCKQNHIQLTLLIVPTHQEFHKKLVDFGLAKEENKFKQEMKQIGRVIDFDFPNAITSCKSCFGDPLHTTDSISNIMVEEIFSDSLRIGREL